MWRAPVNCCYGSGLIAKIHGQACGTFPVLDIYLLGTLPS
jgi:hypothetical protein